MTNIFDYLAWRGDLRFSQAEPCEVDFLIFAQLVHAPLERLMGGGQGWTLSELQPIVYPTPVGADQNVLERSRYALWLAAAKSVRYAAVTLERFEAHFKPEAEMQFAAALFLLDGAGVVCFRGTDATLVGWKEDFNMAFESPVPSQVEAVLFLNESANDLPLLYVCGHSKGGNLALYAAAMCTPQTRAKLQRVFSFDGPGMDEKTHASEGYQAITPRVSSFIPEASVVGLLLNNHETYTIVASDGISIWQHNPYLWHVRGASFVPVSDTTRSSQFTDQTLHDFLAESTPAEQRVLVDTIFKVLGASKAVALKDVPRGIAANRNDVLAVLRGVPPSSYVIMIRALRMLGGAGTENLNLLFGENGNAVG
ncbi:MAG: Mbeg1-like protein [Clostridia bacterium]